MNCTCGHELTETDRLTHRVLCGDATSKKDVGKLMGGERAGLCFTSPPYAQQREYTEASKQYTGDWDKLMQGVFGCLQMKDDGQVLVNLGLIHSEHEWVPYWDSWIEWMRQQGWKRFGWYVWDQGFGLPGNWNGRLGPSHEFVFHFNKTAVEPNKWIEKHPENIKPRNKNESTMRKADGTTVPFTNPLASGQPTKIPDSIIRITRQVGSDGHPAQFPVNLPLFMMRTWLGLVYDPFLGSGTTMVAAEQLGRICYGMEIEPKYIAVILQRMKDIGLEPKCTS